MFLCFLPEKATHTAHRKLLKEKGKYSSEVRKPSLASAPKITKRHIQYTENKMKVRSAAQLFSTTVSGALPVLLKGSSRNELNLSNPEMYAMTVPTMTPYIENSVERHPGLLQTARKGRQLMKTSPPT